MVAEFSQIIRLLDFKIGDLLGVRCFPGAESSWLHLHLLAARISVVQFSCDVNGCPDSWFRDRAAG